MDQKNLCALLEKAKRLTMKDVVYKDECVFCYESNPIFLCIKTLYGFCRAHVEIFNSMRPEFCAFLILNSEQMDLSAQRQSSSFIKFEIGFDVHVFVLPEMQSRIVSSKEISSGAIDNLFDILNWSSPDASFQKALNESRLLLLSNSSNSENLNQISGTGLIGLTNLGNSCFVNVIIQLLFSVDKSNNYFCNSEKMPLNFINPLKDVYTQLLKLGIEVFKERKYALEKAKVINPIRFIKSLSGLSERFSISRQQDAEEFYCLFLNNLQNTPLTEFVNLFRFKYDFHQSKADGKTHYGTDESFILRLPMPIGMHHQLSSLIDQWASDEFGKQRFINFPRYLVIKIERSLFKFAKVSLPPMLNISKYFSGGKVQGEIANIFVENNVHQQLMELGYLDFEIKRSLFYSRTNDIFKLIDFIDLHKNDFVNQIGKAFQSTLAGNEDLLLSLEFIGVERKFARIALYCNKFDVEKATLWYYENESALKKEIQEYELVNSYYKIEKPYTGNGQYSHLGFIYHIGDSVQSGHYVFYSLKNIPSGITDSEVVWTYFNDQSVTLCKELPVEYSYMAIYQQID